MARDNQILVWHSKHCSYYYDASTEEALEDAAIDILDGLIRDRWIGEPEAPRFNPEEQELLALTKEEIASFPASIKAATTEKLKYVNRRLSQFEDEKGEWAEIQAILAGTAEATITRAKVDYDEERWARIVANSRQWHMIELREDGLYRTPSAWQILQNRNGGEYERYELETLITFEKAEDSDA